MGTHPIFESDFDCLTERKMAATVPIIPLPPAPPSLDFMGHNFDCWIMVGGFNLSSADVSAANLIMPRFADQLEAALSGVKRALKAGAKKPLLLVIPDERLDQSLLVAIMGAMQGLYTTLEHRESRPAEASKASALGVWSTCAKQMAVVPRAIMLEKAKAVCRDIQGTDPERMAPPKVEEVVQGHEKLKKEYPCMAAVDRCANQVERHRA